MNLSIEGLQERFSSMPAPPPRGSPASRPEDVPCHEGSETPPPVVCRKTEPSVQGYDLEVTAHPLQVLGAARLLDEEGFAIDMVTAVDWPEENQFELLYDFMHFHGSYRVVVRTRIPRDRPEIPTLSEVFPGANWHERETAEFYGITFTGHPNPIHLLLPEDFEGFPLRKDFKPEPCPP